MGGRQRGASSTYGLKSFSSLSSLQRASQHLCALFNTKNDRASTKKCLLPASKRTEQAASDATPTDKEIHRSLINLQKDVHSSFALSKDIFASLFALRDFPEDQIASLSCQITNTWIAKLSETLNAAIATTLPSETREAAHIRPISKRRRLSAPTEALAGRSLKKLKTQSDHGESIADSAYRDFRFSSALDVHSSDNKRRKQEATNHHVHLGSDCTHCENFSLETELKGEDASKIPTKKSKLAKFSRDGTFKLNSSHLIKESHPEENLWSSSDHGASNEEKDKSREALPGIGSHSSRKSLKKTRLLKPQHRQELHLSEATSSKIKIKGTELKGSASSATTTSPSNTPLTVACRSRLDSLFCVTSDTLRKEIMTRLSPQAKPNDLLPDFFSSTISKSGEDANRKAPQQSVQSECEGIDAPKAHVSPLRLPKFCRKMSLCSLLKLSPALASSDAKAPDLLPSDPLLSSILLDDALSDMSKVTLSPQATKSLSLLANLNLNYERSDREKSKFETIEVKQAKVLSPNGPPECPSQGTETALLLTSDAKEAHIANSACTTPLQSLAPMATSTIQKCNSIARSSVPFFNPLFSPPNSCVTTNASPISTSKIANELLIDNNQLDSARYCMDARLCETVSTSTICRSPLEVLSSSKPERASVQLLNRNDQSSMLELSSREQPMERSCLDRFGPCPLSNAVAASSTLSRFPSVSLDSGPFSSEANVCKKKNSLSCQSKKDTLVVGPKAPPPSCTNLSGSKEKLYPSTVTMPTSQNSEMSLHGAEQEGWSGLSGFNAEKCLLDHQVPRFRPRLDSDCFDARDATYHGQEKAATQVACDKESCDPSKDDVCPYSSRNFLHVSTMLPEVVNRSENLPKLRLPGQSSELALLQHAQTFNCTDSGGCRESRNGSKEKGTEDMRNDSFNGQHDSSVLREFLASAAFQQSSQLPAPPTFIRSSSSQVDAAQCFLEVLTQKREGAFAPSSHNATNSYAPSSPALAGSQRKIAVLSTKIAPCIKKSSTLSFNSSKRGKMRKNGGVNAKIQSAAPQGMDARVQAQLESECAAFSTNGVSNGDDDDAGEPSHLKVAVKAEIAPLEDPVGLQSGRSTHTSRIGLSLSLSSDRPSPVWIDLGTPTEGRTPKVSDHWSTDETQSGGSEVLVSPSASQKKVPSDEKPSSVTGRKKSIVKRSRSKERRPLNNGIKKCLHADAAENHQGHKKISPSSIKTPNRGERGGRDRNCSAANDTRKQDRKNVSDFSRDSRKSHYKDSCQNPSSTEVARTLSPSKTTKWQDRSRPSSRTFLPRKELENAHEKSKNTEVDAGYLGSTSNTNVRRLGSSNDRLQGSRQRQHKVECQVRTPILSEEELIRLEKRLETAPNPLFYDEEEEKIRDCTTQGMPDVATCTQVRSSRRQSCPPSDKSNPVALAVKNIEIPSKPLSKAAIISASKAETLLDFDEKCIPSQPTDYLTNCSTQIKIGYPEPKVAVKKAKGPVFRPLAPQKSCLAVDKVDCQIHGWTQLATTAIPTSWPKNVRAAADLLRCTKCRSIIESFVTGAPAQKCSIDGVEMICNNSSRQCGQPSMHPEFRIRTLCHKGHKFFAPTTTLGSTVWCPVCHHDVNSKNRRLETSKKSFADGEACVQKKQKELFAEAQRMFKSMDHELPTHLPPCMGDQTMGGLAFASDSRRSNRCSRTCNASSEQTARKLAMKDTNQFQGVTLEQALPVRQILQGGSNPWKILQIEQPSFWGTKDRMRAFTTDSKAYVSAKASYRNLARKVHPDKNPHPKATEVFLLVDGAWRQIMSKASDA